MCTCWCREQQRAEQITPICQSPTRDDSTDDRRMHTSDQRRPTYDAHPLLPVPSLLVAYLPVVPCSSCIARVWCRLVSSPSCRRQLLLLLPSPAQLHSDRVRRRLRRDGAQPTCTGEEAEGEKEADTKRNVDYPPPPPSCHSPFLPPPWSDRLSLSLVDRVSRRFAPAAQAQSQPRRRRAACNPPNQTARRLVDDVTNSRR